MQHHSNLLSAKLRPVQIRTNLLARSTLCNELHHNTERYALTVLTAPAGYGKTTLVAQWLAENPRLARGWISLDCYDNRQDRFLGYFTEALQQATGLDFDDLTDDDPIDYLSQLLQRLAYYPRPFFLILDDYHHITHPEIHAMLRFWLKNQPDTMHLILLSRTSPPLSLTDLRLHQRLFEIGSAQLQFSLDQLRQSFAFDQPISEETLLKLHQQLGGWAAAVQMLCQIWQQSPELIHQPEKLLAQLNQHQLADYLEREIFAYLPAEMRDFMQDCAIFPWLNEPLIATLFGDLQPVKKLLELEQAGLFVQREAQTSGQIGWIFHPMIAHYLSQQFRLNDHQRWLNLHQQAAQGWLKLGYGAEALHHAQIAADSDIIHTILHQQGWALFHQGQLKLLEQSLNQLPPENLWHEPNLVLLKGWLAQSQHRYQEVSGILQKFQPNAPLDRALQGKFEALKAQVAINSGDDELAYQLANQALANLSSEFGYAQVVALSIIGEALHCRGSLKEGLAQMQQVEQMALAQHAPHQWLWSRLQQAEMLSAQGFWQSAFDLLKQSRQRADYPHQIPMHEFLLRLKGQILWEWHELEQAEAMALAGIEVLPNQGDQVHCLALLAKISLTKGDLSNAERLIQQCRMNLSHQPLHRDWLSTFDEIQLFYWQLREDYSAVKSWLAQASRPTSAQNHFTQRQWRNIARGNLLVGDIAQGLAILNRLLDTAERYQLVSEIQRNLILRNRFYFQQGRHDLAQKDLIQALNLSQQTNFISAFVIEGDGLASQIRSLLQLNVLNELTTHKAQFILRSINQHNRHKFAHFDQAFVENLLNNPQLPELLKISPLTMREWQVLGLIYSGYSNEQIAQELVVAMTTIKTHIRNLYQKIGVANRNEAIEYTQNLLKTMGYS